MGVEDFSGQVPFSLSLFFYSIDPLRSGFFLPDELARHVLFLLPRLGAASFLRLLPDIPALLERIFLC